MEISSEDYKKSLKIKNGVLVFRSGKKTEVIRPWNQVIQIAATNIKKEKEIVSKTIAKSKSTPTVLELPLDEQRELKTYFIEITPNTKPRMTRRDKWLSPPRPPVLQYRCFKDKIHAECERLGIGELPSSIYSVKFYIKCPESWSGKKKREMNGKRHTTTPDIDNFLKALFDSMHIQDKHIAEITNGLGKYWSTEKEGILIII